MKNNKIFRPTIKVNLGLMSFALISFVLISEISLLQLSKTNKLREVNSAQLKYISELDASLFFSREKQIYKKSIEQYLNNIHLYAKQCVELTNVFYSWYRQYVGLNHVSGACFQDKFLVQDMLQRFKHLHAETLSHELKNDLFEVATKLTKNTINIERKIGDVNRRIIRITLWWSIPSFLLLAFSLVFIYKYIIQSSKEIKLAAAALSDSERENWQMAYFDSLTGLPNRNLFNERLEKAILKAQRNNEKIVVMFLDLDRFKHVNDTYGHVAGDQLIYESSLRFSSQLRESDTIARFGGDEFVILLQGLRNEEDVGKIANKIINAINEPFLIADNNVSVGTSIGIAIYPKDGHDSETLLKNADVAMYVSKERGKNQYCIHDETIRDKAARLALIESRLKFAILESSLSLVYQPVVNLNTMRVQGAEVLLRWNDKQLGFVSPDEFIPVAEDSGQIIGIGEWVFESACEKLNEWRKQYNKDIYLSVNISGRQLKDSNFIKFIKDTLGIYKLPYNAINLEITENVFYSNDKRAVETIRELSELGMYLLLDDFGTGYSSLSTLTSLPFDFVKIDKSFLMEGSEKNFKTSSTIIDMAKNFNMGIIAEGVEHTETVKFLMERDCEYAQGYLFSKPCPEEEIDLLKDYSSLFSKKNNEEVFDEDAIEASLQSI